MTVNIQHLEECYDISEQVPSGVDILYPSREQHTISQFS